MTILSDQILELRKQGLNYNQIQEKLKCSKGTISFHCGDGQKQKSLKRNKKRRKNNPLKTKIESFIYSKYIVKNTPHNSKNTLYRKIIKFHFNKKTKKYQKLMFSLKELEEKIGPYPVCYLTGRPIDLSKSRQYNLDHIIPRSKGGDNSLDNCQIACKEANMAKSDLSYNEFVNLCHEVINHNNLNK